mgnify:CR=1 FL=1
MKQIVRNPSLTAFVVFLIAAVASHSLAERKISEAPNKRAREVISATGIHSGVVVHLHCDGGRLTEALHANGSFLVQGLDTDPADIRRAREYISQEGSYGPVSVQLFEGKHLPYVRNTVNLIVSEGATDVPMEEVKRVLKPGGVAYIGDEKIVKQRPGDMDEWTHFLHDSGGNAVSQDERIHPPKALRWVAKPLHCRSHEFPSSVQAVVTSNGRIFTILDEAPAGVYEKLPQKCRIVARDAFNGKLLWKVPLRKWSKEYGTGSGGRYHIHHTLPRRIIAKGDHVYATLKFLDSPVSVLDAQTGQIAVEALEGTKGTDEMVLSRSTLVVKTTPQRSPDAPARVGPGKVENSITAVDVNKEERLWTREDTDALPYTLAAREGSILYHTPKRLVCLDLKTGEQRWYSEDKVNRIRAGRNNLVVRKNTVLYHDGSNLTAFDLQTGRELWKHDNSSPLSGASVQPTEVFVIGDTVWSGASTKGYDLRTGNMKQEVNLYNLITGGHHRRCHRAKATKNYIIRNKRGAEFVDLDGENHMRYNWIRGPCFTGVTPANGMLYIPPDQCFCYPGVKIDGYTALASDPVKELKPAGYDNLMRGEAYERDIEQPDASPEDWPMYRHDAERSGSSISSVPADLRRQWQTTFSGETTQPVVVGDRLWLAVKDAHRIHCLDAGDGNEMWQFTADARIDSAPTYYKGRLLFGSRRGSVYCLRADNGKLIWKFDAAPDPRQIVSFEQWESLWPVHGSVAVEGGKVYFAAGRSSFLNGGIIVYGLDPATGEVLHTRTLQGPWPDIKKESGRPFAMEGALSDLIVSDGENLYMQRIKFDTELNRIETQRGSHLGELDMGSNHLTATGGFLDDSGFDRLYWMYSQRWPGFYFSRHAPKSGQLVVFNDETTFAVKYFYYRKGWSPHFKADEKGYLLFADDNDNQPGFLREDKQDSMVEWLPKEARAGGARSGGRGVEKGTGYVRHKPPRWKKTIPVRIRAMACAADNLVVAGPPDKIPSDEPFAAFEGELGAKLMVVSASDGTIITQHELKHPPVFDGMSVARNKLFLALGSGKIVCYGK